VDDLKTAKRLLQQNNETRESDHTEQIKGFSDPSFNIQYDPPAQFERPSAQEVAYKYVAVAEPPWSKEHLMPTPLPTPFSTEFCGATSASDLLIRRWVFDAWTSLPDSDSFSSLPRMMSLWGSKKRYKVDVAEAVRVNRNIILEFSGSCLAICVHQTVV
jgi:hypothetical protein